ncbi:MAG: MFS transporter [Arachnia sp.]
MGILDALRRLGRHQAFRRLLIVRVLGQAADGTLQVGMGSHILFSPQSQATAWDVTAILALTLLPYTLIGPFVSPLLDRWSRRNVAVYSDLIRAGLALIIGGLILFGWTTGPGQIGLYAALLMALAINRFLLAGLSAGLQHTVEPDEYLTASSVTPMVGPLGVVVGGVLGFTVRLGLGGVIGTNGADAVIFGCAAVMFLGAVSVSRRFTRDGLGPEPGRQQQSVREVARGIREAFGHVRRRPPVALAIGVMAGGRLLFGMLSVTVILIARHVFNPPDQPEAALGDITVWGLATGAGFIIASAVVPVAVRRWGLRASTTGFLVMLVLAQAAMAVNASMWVLLPASFLIGLGVQAVKIGADTVVQAHVKEQFKGRVFTLYDVAFNSSLVLAGVIAAAVLPADGLAPAVFAGMALAYGLLAVGFEVASRAIGAADFERGTEDLVSR